MDLLSDDGGLGDLEDEEASPEVDIDGLDDIAGDMDRGGIEDIDSSDDVRIKVTGNAQVVLVGDGGRYSVPGKVPPGKYDIEAKFGAEKAAIVGTVKVRKKSVTVACSDRMGICRAE